MVHYASLTVLGKLRMKPVPTTLSMHGAPQYLKLEVRIQVAAEYNGHHRCHLILGALLVLQACQASVVNLQMVKGKLSLCRLVSTCVCPRNTLRSQQFYAASVDHKSCSRHQELIFAEQRV